MQREQIFPTPYLFNSSASVRFEAGDGRSASLDTTPDASAISAGGGYLIIEIFSDRFIRGTEASILSAMSSSGGHWEAHVLPHISTSMAVLQHNGSLLNITLPTTSYALEYMAFWFAAGANSTSYLTAGAGENIAQSL